MIKKVVYEGIKKSEVAKKCMALANGFSILFDSSLIHNDMIISVEDFLKNASTGKMVRTVYYMAIRERGVESGSEQQHVKERCDALGQPVCVIKLEAQGSEVTMRINTEI